MIITATFDTKKFSSVMLECLAQELEDSQALAALARHESANVRGRVAKNPKTSQDTLDELASDENWIVRLDVAYNPTTSQKTLSEKLAKDKLDCVQETAKRRLNSNQ